MGEETPKGASARVCLACGGSETTYAAFSGGREMYCSTCDDNYAIPPGAADAPRATLLQTEAGRVTLRAQMDRELTTARDVGPGTVGEAESGEAPASPALVITVHGTPAPQGSKRHVGRGIMVESSKKVKPWREAVKHAALDATRVVCGSCDAGLPMTCVCPEPLTGPVEVGVVFYLTRPKHHYRTGRNAHLLRDNAPAYPAGKPDLDKLLRSTLDALGDAGVWHDDSQVVRFRGVDKVYGATAGAHIRVQAAA